MTKAFGTMWVCYLFMIYGFLPLFAIFRPAQDTFLYWSNWVQLWSLPLILVGTNILGRDAEVRAKLDHEKLAQSYDEQLIMYNEIVEMITEHRAMLSEVQNLKCHPKSAAYRPSDA
jgi:hypothetical protein